MRRLQLLPREAVEVAEEREVLHGGEVGVKGEVLGDVADGRLGLEGAAIESVDETSPSSATVSPHSMEMVVVFPAPFGPRRP